MTVISNSVEIRCTPAEAFDYLSDHRNELEWNPGIESIDKLTDGPVGLVLLDGWKNLCLPVLRLLEPKLAPGALVVADDITFTSMADYLGYVRDPASGYVSVTFPVEDGMEISTWTGR